MFKNKIFLYGLGFGVLFTALLSGLLGVAEKAQLSSPAPLLQSDKANLAELKARAGELGYEIMKKDEKRYTEADVEAARRQAAEEAGKKQPPGQASRTVLIVTPQSDAGVVATALVQAGLVSDRSLILEELNNRQLTNKLQVGTYVFEGKPDMSAIVTRITTTHP